MTLFNRRNIIWLTIILLILISGASYYYWQSKSNANKNYLASIEVRQYEGKNLSSINDLRDVSIKGPQQIDINKYRLSISGLVENPREFTYDQIISGYPSYKKAITLNCVEGWSANILWEGVLLKDIFADVKVKSEATNVIFYSVDGYTTSLPLKYLVDNNILLAYKINGVKLQPETGYPFTLAAESKWGYKWAKWINKIELSADNNYQGYWESRGYSTGGDLNQPFTK